MFCQGINKAKGLTASISGLWRRQTASLHFVVPRGAKNLNPTTGADSENKDGAAVGFAQTVHQISNKSTSHINNFGMTFPCGGSPACGKADKFLEGFQVEPTMKWL